MTESRLIELLQELNFTQYEAKILEVLIRYNFLSASEINKYSGVPQSKVYQITANLQQKGFIDVHIKGNTKVFS